MVRPPARADYISHRRTYCSCVHLRCVGSRWVRFALGPLALGLPHAAAGRGRGRPPGSGLPGLALKVGRPSNDEPIGNVLAGLP